MFKPGNNPYSLFKKWFGEAQSRPVPREAMVLSTVGKKGMPSSRTVLLKGLKSGGFCFYTNLQSRKARELLEHKQASLLFFWPAGAQVSGFSKGRYDRQIRLEGRVTLLSRKENERYFATRPREAQLGAWASFQSQPLKKATDFEERMAVLAQVFEGEKIPCPPYWGGFCLQPEQFEFWEAGLNRLHTRFRFAKKRGSSWKSVQLYP